MRAAGCECWQQEVIRAHTLPHLAAEITGRLESPAGPPCFETMMHNNRMGGLLPAPPPPLRLTHAVTCLSPERPPPPLLPRVCHPSNASLPSLPASRSPCDVPFGSSISHSHFHFPRTCQENNKAAIYEIRVACRENTGSISFNSNGNGSSD